MSVEQNKGTVTRVFEEAFNRGELGIIDDVVSPVGIDHQHPDEPNFCDHLKDVVVALRTAFPDLHFEITEMIGEGEWIACHSFMSGTNTGQIRPPLLPPNGPPLIPPTGRPIRIAHMHLIRFQDGLNTELWHVMDSTALMGQLGLLPAGDSVRVQQ